MQDVLNLLPLGTPMGLCFGATIPARPAISATDAAQDGAKIPHWTSQGPGANAMSCLMQAANQAYRADLLCADARVRSRCT